jgi:lysophospholipase L1-like esterase
MRLFQIKFGLLLGLVLVTHPASRAQDPIRFQKEVDSIVALHQSFDKDNLILFTGSSSVRMWKNLKSSFPRHNVMNMGFGGSEMADLLYFTNKLIIPFQPVQIFIYEGDNDLSFGRTSEDIIASADGILSIIRKSLPKAEVVFISPKPSLARWALKEKYEDYVTKLEKWTAGKSNVRFVDMWTPMLDASGTVRQDIFISDGLHLNDSGYAIWTTTLQKYLRPAPK